MVLERTCNNQLGGASVADRLRAEHKAKQAAVYAATVAPEASAARLARTGAFSAAAPAGHPAHQHHHVSPELDSGAGRGASLAAAASGATVGEEKAGRQASGFSGSPPPSARRPRPPRLIITYKMIVSLLSGKDIVIQYKLTEQGGASTVYKGTFNGETVLIKVIKNNINTRNEVINEKDTLLYLENIPGVLRHRATFGFLVGGDGEDLSDLGARGEGEKHVYCILTEYIEGSDLFTYINEANPLDIIERYNLVRSVADFLLQTMAEIHNQGFIHGDLKLENIMVRQDTRWDFIIIDFGFASRVTDPPITRGGCVYLAPEVVIYRQEKSYDKLLVDLYAIGIILYTLIFLGYPFPRESFRVGKIRTPISEQTKFNSKKLEDFAPQQNNMTIETYQRLEMEQIEETKNKIGEFLAKIEEHILRVSARITEQSGLIDGSVPSSFIRHTHELRLTELEQMRVNDTARKNEWREKLQDLEKFEPDENITNIIVNLLSYDPDERHNPFQTGPAPKRPSSSESKTEKRKKAGGGKKKKKRKRKLKRSYRKFRKKKTKRKQKTKNKK